jgi:hypothetical protein
VGLSILFVGFGRRLICPVRHAETTAISAR